MPSYGRNLLTVHNILPTHVSADGNPKVKVAGAKINLASLAAAPSSDVTLPDGSIIKANSGRYLRYGQVMTKMSTPEVQTVTIGGTATGGTFTLTLPAVGNDPAQTTTALAFNATAQNMADALNALTRISAWGIVVVSLAGAVYTITFPSAAGNPPQLTNTNSLTGTSPTVTNATTTAGLATNGEYGPYDSAATDGRQTLTRGDCFILDETWLESPAGGGPLAGVGSMDITGGLIEGGDVWKERLLMTTGSASLAAGPTVTNLLAAFPRISLVSN